MAIVIEDVEIERLAHGIALAKGVPVAEVVRESLLPFLAGQRDVPAGRRALRERLAVLAGEVDALPARMPVAIRGDDEILGYGEHGSW